MILEYEIEEKQKINVPPNKLKLIGGIIQAAEKSKTGPLTEAKNKKYPYGDLFDKLYERPPAELMAILKYINTNKNE